VFCSGLHSTSREDLCIHLRVAEKGSRLRNWLMVVLWMAVIFAGSSEFFSSQRTSRVIGPLLRWFIADVSDETIRAVQMFVRKGCHLGEYAVLALLLWRAVRRPYAGGTRPWSWREAAYVLAGAGLYAVTDELHQSLIPSRAGTMSDVLLDLLGVIIGLGLLWGYGRWRKDW